MGLAVKKLLITEIAAVKRYSLPAVRHEAGKMPRTSVNARRKHHSGVTIGPCWLG